MFLPGKEICLKSEGYFCEERSLSSDLGERCGSLGLKKKQAYICFGANLGLVVANDMAARRQT